MTRWAMKFVDGDWFVPMVREFPKMRKVSLIAPMVPLFELSRFFIGKRVAPAGKAMAENA